MRNYSHLHPGAYPLEIAPVPNVPRGCRFVSPAKPLVIGANTLPKRSDWARAAQINQGVNDWIDAVEDYGRLAITGIGSAAKTFAAHTRRAVNTNSPHINSRSPHL